jgi:hypothetical protein
MMKGKLGTMALRTGDTCQYNDIPHKVGKSKTQLTTVMTNHWLKSKSSLDLHRKLSVTDALNNTLIDVGEVLGNGDD